MKIAIIGSGISGLTAAWMLHKQHDITVYEGQNYIGGHTHTVDVELDG
ncbi:MAG: FAD-dependent oxidoreductase, partial [Planctomycetaceae bacterium]